MNSTYAQKSSTVQKVADSKAASVLDSSAQSESLQRKADMANNAAQRAESPRPNNTGMPDNLKAGIESLSGFSMDDVRVHYNSSKPATVQALAYTQGTDIHVAPGQEKCLPHEAWHVAQQMAGRVSPTTSINGMPVNDNAALEHEADVMGEKAVSQMKYEYSESLTKKKVNADCRQRMPKISGHLYSNYKYLKRKDEYWVENSFLGNGAEIVYKNEINAKSKVDALQEISKKAGELGKNLPPENQGCLDGELFKVKYNAKYETRNSKKPVNLSLTYQFGKRWTGYVVNVDKSTKGGGRRIAGMVEGKSTMEGTYSNAHELLSGSVLSNTYNKINGESGIKNKTFKGSIPDAYTKLAGEGARFDCVRRNMQWINDDTVFYKKDDNPDKRGVMFRDLWLTWSACFKKAYDIKDDEIVRKFDGKFTLPSSESTRVGGVSNPKNCVPLDGKSTLADGLVGVYTIAKDILENRFKFEFDAGTGKWKHPGNFYIYLTVKQLEGIEKNVANETEIKKTLINSFLSTYNISLQAPIAFPTSDIYDMITQKNISLACKKNAIVALFKMIVNGNNAGQTSKKTPNVKKKVSKEDLIGCMWIKVFEQTPAEKLEDPMKVEVARMVIVEHIEQYIKTVVEEYISKHPEEEGMPIHEFRKKMLKKFEENGFIRQDVMNVYWSMINKKILIKESVNGTVVKYI